MKPIHVILIVAVTIESSNSSPIEQYTGSLHRTKRGTPAADWEQKRWPNATVFYLIDEGLESIREDLVRAMKQVESISCVRYVLRRDEADYVFIQNNTICKEPVGRQGGEQIIQINITECGVYGFYLHAMMQVLGFYHEHQRFDRDEHVTVFEENIDPDWLDWSFTKLNSSSHFYNSSYDIDSIMHYGSYQYSMNGKPTLLAKDGTELLPWTDKTDLSDLDKLAINDYYGCSATGSK